ncbi:hypothetical protein [Methyloversatilis discipulorum]|uniref:hypothetical protein n=1 Tax=Methyloversatilis discipulorum TaxID=1119528 RepID=UPI0026EF2D24|nr:hypothetical protein [Methyloversatilis discipulorum]
MPTTSLAVDLRKRLGWPLLIALLVTAAASAGLRYGLMESDLLHGLCAGGADDWRCLVRRVAPQLFMQERIGVLALAAGALALLLRYALVARLAVVAGAAGLVLYSADFAAVGLLAGLLVLLARAPASVNTA